MQWISQNTIESKRIAGEVRVKRGRWGLGGPVEGQRSELQFLQKMSACICLLLLLSICGAAFPASSGLHPTAVLRTGTASGGSMRVAALRGGTRDEVDDSFDERVERGLGGGELSGTLHDSPASRDRPMRRGGEVNQDEDHPASAPRRLNFDSPEDVPARASGGFGGGCGRFLRRESCEEAVPNLLLDLRSSERISIPPPCHSCSP